MDARGQPEALEAPVVPIEKMQFFLGCQSGVGWVDTIVWKIPGVHCEGNTDLMVRKTRPEHMLQKLLSMQETPNQF